MKSYIVMGVSGCGKTTIAEELAKRMNAPFIEGDDFHPFENIEKMKAGIPLDDNDRKPWLEALNNELKIHPGSVLSCSSLKKSYRETLSKGISVEFIYLKIDQKTAIQRLETRKDHFMPGTLVESQFETLEEPEDAVIIDGLLSKEEIIKLILQSIR